MIKKKCAFCGKPLIVRLNKTKYHQECYFKSLKGNGNPFYCKKHTTKTKEKLSLANKGNTYSLGVKRSDETRKKLSENAKKRVGNKNSFYGKKHTLATKKRISQSRTGKCLGELNSSKKKEVIEKIRQKMFGRKITWGSKISNTRKILFKNGKLIAPNTGSTLSEQHRMRLSKTRIERGVAKLSKNPMWKGGLSYEPYPLTWTRVLREQVRMSYQNKCFKCENYEISKDKRTNNTRKIPIHHINYIKEDVRPINLIPLCTKCHAEVNNDRDYWFAFFCYKQGISPNDLIV